MKFVASSCSQTSPQPNASSSSIPHSSSRHGVGTIPILFTIFLIIFSFCITDVNSMIVEKDKFSISSDHRFTTLFSFVFEKDGTLDFHMNITKPSEEDFVVLFCDESELEKLRDPDMTFERVCAKPKPGLCKHETIIPKKSEKEVWKLDNYVMPKQSRYRVLQLNCKQRPYSGTLSYTAVNPGGEYLSLIYIPYKTLFYFISAMWGGLLLLWCFNLFQYAAWNTKAQRLLIFVPFFKAVTSIIMIGYWRQSSKTGHAPKHFYWLGLASLLSARGILFFSVLMLAIGFGLTRSSIPSAYSKRMAIMVGFYVLALGMHHLNLEMAFLLMVIDYAFIWQLLAMFISYTQNELDLQASLLQQMTVRVSSTPLYPKIKALKELQSAMVVFVLADLFLLFWSSVFAVNMPWMDELLENLNMFILLVRVYRVYRLRPFNPHLNSLAKAHTQTLTAQEATLVIDELQTRIVSLDRPTSTDGSITLDSTLWKPGKSYPRPLPLDLEMIVKPAAPRESCVTMIHNPCTCAYQQQQTQNAQVGSVGSVNAGVDGGSGSGSIYSSTSYSQSQSQSPGSRQQQNLMYNEHTCVHTDIGVLFAKLERPKAPVVSSDIHGYNRIGSGSISGNRDNNSQDDHGFTVISPLASERDPGSLHYDADESGYEMSSTSPKLAKKSKKTPSSASTSSMNGIEADAKDATSPTTMTDSLSPSNKSPNSRSSTRADRENARNNSSLGNILSRATSSKSSTKYERLANEDDN